MLTLSFNRPPNAGLDVLLLGAHADDIEIGCGGTILRLVRDGMISAARWVVLSGSAERAREAEEGAARFLEGVAEQTVVVERFRDGFMPYAGSAVKDFFETLKPTVRPDLIFAPRREDIHQDHRLVGELTWNTFRHHLILEYEIPKYEGDPASPNLYVTIPDWAARQKADLIAATFRTQADRTWFSRETFLSQMRLRAIESRSSSGFAEAFVCRKVVL